MKEILMLQAGMHFVGTKVQYSITNYGGKQLKSDCSKQDLEKIISDFKKVIANFRATIKRGIRTEKEFRNRAEKVRRRA